MYEVIMPFKDTKDAKHEYLVGDIYPREGKKSTKKRTEELLSDANKAGYPLIKEIVEEEVVEDEAK